MEPTPGDLNESSNDLGDLDGMLAELEGKPAETAEQVQERVKALIEAVNRAANADRGTGPQGESPPPVVVLDSGQFDTFGPGQLLNVGLKDSTDGGIVQLIIKCGGHGFNTADLQTHVSSINSVYRSITAHAPVPLKDCESAIVQQLTACQSSLAELRDLVGDQALDVPSPQAAAVICFDKTYPQVWPQLGKEGVRVKFNSSASDNHGGGFFRDNIIHMSGLLVTPAGVFVRLLVHEIGHALFETRLLNRKTMPHYLVADKLADLSVAQTTLWERSKECQSIHRFWDEMSDQAKTFYQAWHTLRKDGGPHLLGIDLWEDPRRNRLDPAQRRRYQAGNFGEFCAEVFMLYAMGDLRAHVLGLLDRDDVSQDVKTAWKNAWHVLQTVAAPILRPPSVV
jgi:hypothetical protein